MASDTPEVSPEYINYILRRAEKTKQNKGYDLRVDLRWISVARLLVTTEKLASQMAERIMHYTFIAEMLEDQELAKDVKIVFDSSLSSLKKFNDKLYSPMDLSPATVVVCNTTFQNLISEISPLTDDDIIASLFKEVQEVHTRVSANGMLQGKKVPGLMSFFKPKVEMRPDIIRLIENLAAVKTALHEPGSRFLNSEASKN